MTPIRWKAAARLVGTAILALVISSSLAHAQGLIGKWSAEQTCGAQSAQIVFRGTTMELWEASRRLFTGSVRFRSSGNETSVTIVSVGRGTQQLPGNPEVGDVSSFRRDGNLMFPVAFTRNGQRRAAPAGTPPFYLCP